jgi:hypothetical protein
MTLDIHRKTYRRSAGALQLSFLDKGRIVVGQLLEGRLEGEELALILEEAGIRTGLIESGIELIGKGSTSEIPLAVVRIIELPAQTTSEVFHLPRLEEALASGVLPDLSDVDILFPVKAGDALLSVEAPPKTVMRFPTGETRLLKEWESVNPELFSGVHTSVPGQGNTIVADIDGLAQRTAYGQVSVYPVESLPGVGELHGKIEQGNAVVVEGDVKGGSHLVTEGNIHVRESVSGAYIHAGGNLQVDMVIDNPTGSEKAQVRAGQHLLTRVLKDSTVIVGSQAIITEEVSRCDLTCLNSLITPVLIGSRIRAANTVIAGDIRGETQIELGTAYTRDSRHEDHVQEHSQHLKRLDDRREGLKTSRFKFNRAQGQAATQIRRMQDPKIPTSHRHNAMQILKKLLTEMEAALATFKTDYEDFLNTAREVAQEEVGLGYYQHWLESYKPQVDINGTAEAGLVIKNGLSKVAFDEERSGVRVRVDAGTGRLVTESLD